MSFRILAASISFTNACRSLPEIPDVSTLNGVGAKRLAIFSSCAKSGSAAFFCAFTEIPVTPKSSTRIKQAVSFMNCSSPVNGKAKTDHDSRRMGGRGRTFRGTICERPRAKIVEDHKALWACAILMRKVLPCLLFVSVVAMPFILRADDAVIEEIIARVNNQIITRSEYLHSKEELKKEAQQQDPVNADKIVAERDKDVLRDLIDQQLLLAKGKDLGITADTEVIKKLDEMRKDMKLDSMEELEKAAQSQGVSFEDFKQNLRNQIITQQVIGKEVGSRLSISKEEEQKFYDDHKAEMEQPETIRLSEILVSTDAK